MHWFVCKVNCIIRTTKFCFQKLVSITHNVKSLTSNEGSISSYTIKQSFCIWVTNVEFNTGAENYTNKFKGSYRLMYKKIANNTFVICEIKICKSSITQSSINILHKKQNLLCIWMQKDSSVFLTRMTSASTSVQNEEKWCLTFLANYISVIKVIFIKHLIITLFSFKLLT